jgi:hypothetical protein
METVSVLDVREVLDQWIVGQLTASEVHAWAETRYLSEEWEPESEAVNFVLSELDRLDMNLLTLEDAPVFLKALQGPDTKRVIGNHYASMDIEARRRALASDPLYAPFCRGGQ